MNEQTRTAALSPEAAPHAHSPQPGRRMKQLTFDFFTDDPLKAVIQAQFDRFERDLLEGSGCSARQMKMLPLLADAVLEQGKIDTLITLEELTTIFNMTFKSMLSEPALPHAVERVLNPLFKDQESVVVGYKEVIRLPVIQFDGSQVYSYAFTTNMLNHFKFNAFAETLKIAA